jgi:hypothetical protein
MDVATQFQALAALLPETEDQYPLNRSGRPQDRYRCFKKIKILLVPKGVLKGCNVLPVKWISWK